ncbi:hypothetical protein MNBD_UNCLBAC01-944 [hydrothermal vent metagenome]|uniref:Uncharacterized protein n=1 Tax=hydrothermal vent metagenome TaxID=652676 RepID=A0A3B1DGP9_9ZZZZ
MCPLSYGATGSEMGMMICFGVKVFLVLWIIFVPIVITARLEKIAKLLEAKK